MQIRTLGSTLAALMIAAALTACGGSAGSSTTQSATQSATAPESSSSLAAVAPADASSIPEKESNKKIHLGILEENSIENGAANISFAPVIEANIFQLGFYPSLNTMLLELEAGRIDAMRAPYLVCKYLAASNSKLKMDHCGDSVSSDFYMATRSEDVKLNKELSDAIYALKADGTVAGLIAEHLMDKVETPAPIALVQREGVETYKVAITGDLPPIDFVAADGTPAGFNVAFLNAISEKIGCNFEIVQLEATARLTALMSGKIDFIFWINCMTADGSAPVESGITLTPSYYNEALGLVSYSQDVLDKVVTIMVEKTGSPSAEGTAS